MLSFSLARKFPTQPHTMILKGDLQRKISLFASSEHISRQHVHTSLADVFKQHKENEKINDPRKTVIHLNP